MNKTIFNCPNCGAPVKSYKCEYCDTIFHYGWSPERIEQLQKEKIEYYQKRIEELSTEFLQADLIARTNFQNYNIRQSLQYKGGI